MAGLYLSEPSAVWARENPQAIWRQHPWLQLLEPSQAELQAWEAAVMAQQTGERILNGEREYSEAPQTIWLLTFTPVKAPCSQLLGLEMEWKSQLG